MTLAQRILLAISVLVVLVTVALTVTVQRAWEAAAQEQFLADFSSATARLRQQLADEVAQLPAQLEPLCKHGQMVDSTLTDLRAGGLDRERKYALSLLVPSTQRAFGFDELILATSRGEILGAHRAGLIGSTEERFAHLAKSPASSRLLQRDGSWRIEAHCSKVASNHGVVLFAAKYLDPILQRVGALHGLRLSHDLPDDRPERFIRSLTLPELQGAKLFASPKRMTVDKAVARLNTVILQWGALVLAVALLLGFWFARRLAKPIVELSKQARQVVEGHPSPIRAAGGAELKEFALSFNRTLDDLVRLRKRLAIIERIAAQREIARRVAHEIKNPLAPIQAAIETLRRLRARRAPEFDEYFDEATSTVLGEVRRIATIVSEFTEFARMPPPKPTHFDFARMLQSVVQLHQRDEVSMEVNGVSVAEVYADRDQCVQVVTNLLQNALDAVTGGAEARVQVGLETTGEHIALTIADNGPGIDPARRAEVFKPYVSTKEGGTGLGLAIAQRIVVEHGGDLRLDHSPLGGAAFVVTLPVAGPAVVLDEEAGSTTLLR